MTQPFPMLAAKVELEALRFPVLGFAKIDGIRAVIHQCTALSRKLLPLPNHQIQRFFADPRYQGLDGEIVVGAPNDPLCIKHSTSGVMRRTGEPGFTLHVFDKWDMPGVPYKERYAAAAKHVHAIDDPKVQLLPLAPLRDMADVDEFENRMLDDGYEGIILRDPDGIYKHGRSTVREGGLLKMKRFEDSEALVVAVVEERANGNAALRDNLGRTKRSSAKAGKTGKGRMGALTVRDIAHGWEFEIGTGFSAVDREEWWNWHEQGCSSRRIVKYKYFPIGMQDLPRHPVFLARRDEIDL